MLKYLLAAVAIWPLAATAPALAQPSANKGIVVSEVWARASAGAAKIGAAYAKIANPGEGADRLVSASSPVAGTVELHTMAMEGDVMKMRAVPSIDVAPGATVELKPGGLHIMLIDLKAPLKEGTSFPLTLSFEKGGSSTLQVQVRGIAATSDMPNMHKGGH